MALADYLDSIPALVRDGASLLDTLDHERALAAAVARYSSDKPRPAVEDVAAAGGHILALPGGWEPDFSTLTGIEYPIDQHPPARLPGEAWELYLGPGGWQIRVAGALPAAAPVRLRYTIAHAVTPTGDSIPATHRRAVASLAAALLCGELAAHYANDQAPTIQADSAPGRSKAQEYAARERALRQSYADQLGVQTHAAVPAGVTVNLRATDSRGEDRLMHPERYR